MAKISWNCTNRNLKTASTGSSITPIKIFCFSPLEFDDSDLLQQKHPENDDELELPDRQHTPNTYIESPMSGNIIYLFIFVFMWNWFSNIIIIYLLFLCEIDFQMLLFIYYFYVKLIFKCYCLFIIFMWNWHLFFSDGTIEEDFEQALAREMVTDRRGSGDQVNAGNVTIEGMYKKINYYWKKFSI